MPFRLVTMRLERLAQFVGLTSLRHFRKCAQNLLLGEINVLEGFIKQNV